MDPQFQDLAREIADAVEKRLSGEFEERIATRVEERLSGAFEERIVTKVEERLSGTFEERIKKHFNEFETRIERRLQMHFESMGEKVKRAAEGYGGTLESIDRRLDRLEKEWKRNFKLHSAVLKDHAGRIEVLEKRD